MSEIQLQIKEATGADAKAVLAVSQQLGEETDFLLMDESGLALPEALLAEHLDAIYEDYWGLGLGSLLIEELLDWVVEVGELTRIELTVQARNLRAIHLYQKFGFLTEGCMKEAVQTREGQKVDVLMMARLFES